MELEIGIGIGASLRCTKRLGVLIYLLQEAARTVRLRGGGVRVRVRGWGVGVEEPESLSTTPPGTSPPYPPSWRTLTQAWKP